MDRRTKILAVAFGSVIAYVLIAQAIYPRWIKPLMTIDELIAQRQAELDKLEKMQADVTNAKIAYRDYVARIGSFDTGPVETDVRNRVNALIEKHRLQDSNVTPARPTEDRKTGLTTMVINLTATGTLEAAINFLKDVSELPQLVRVGNLALSPAGAGRKEDKKDMVNLRVPLELQVLPQHRVVGRIDPATLTRPEAVVRHEGRDYSEIWNRKPFTPYVKPAPLRVDVQRTLVADVGQPAFLHANASGGEGNYTYSWTPTEGLGEPGQARTSVDTSAVRTQSYTVTVTDTARENNTASATVAVTVKDKQKEVVADRPPPPPPPPPVEPRDMDAQSKQIVMTLLRSAGDSRTHEVMVNNSKARQTSYHKVGEDFDGGKLVYVHQTGGVVRTKDKFYVYPLGAGFMDRIDYQQADEYPELKSAAQRGVAMLNARAQAPPVNPPSAPVGNEPAPTGQPTMDAPDPSAAGPPIADPAPAEAVTGPAVAEPPAQPEEAETLAGPPAHATPAPPSEGPRVQPGGARPNPRNPSQPPKGGNQKPRPKRGRV